MVKVCSKCGNQSSVDAKFCGKCGNKFEEKNFEKEKKIKCRKCGAELKRDAKYCVTCGEKQVVDNENIHAYIKKGVNNFTTTINNMAGEEGEVDIHIKELFSELFTKHTLEEKEELFVCGTSKTTPKETDMIAEWPKPWLYSRIFLMLLIVFAGLYFMILGFENSNAIPGAMFIGAMIVPFSFVVFFWEVNVPRNISIFEVVSVFFMGGVLSLISTLFMYGIVGGVSELDYYGAVLVGITEEVGKIIVVGYYIKKNNYKYVLNGLLLGACVGAGFAVFETAGYAFSSLLESSSISYMMHTLFIRAILAIGGHVVWTAIAGVGIIVAKGDDILRREHWFNIAFLKFLVFVIILHAIWDMPISFGSSFYFVQWCLTGIAILTVLTLINSGLKQVSSIVEKAKEDEKQYE